MKLLKYLLVAALTLAPPLNVNAAGWLLLTKSGAVAYTGPGDVVSGAVGWWGLRGYNQAYATANGNAADICLPADTTCATATIATNGSLSVPGSLSTCNITTVLCTIKQLYDQSGANNCIGAPCHVSNTTIAQRPYYVPPLSGNGCPTTSQPCINWNQSGVLGLATPGNFAIGAQPYTISVVTSLTSAAATGSLFVCSSGPFITTDTVPNFNDYAGTNITFGISTGTWYTNESVINGASSIIYRSGTASSTQNAGTNNCANGGTITLGWDSFNFYYRGFTTELGFWNIAFNATQAGNVDSNQRTYWGF